MYVLLVLAHILTN